MKETKKQRKLRKGMNAATVSAFRVGYKKPGLFGVGSTYVNHLNFGVFFPQEELN